MAETSILDLLMSSYAIDCARAFPAATARILLGRRTEPSVGMWSGVMQKIGAIVGSVAMAMVCGELARGHASTEGWTGAIVLAVAFNAQHICSVFIKLSDRYITASEKEATKEMERRFRNK